MKTIALLVALTACSAIPAQVTARADAFGVGCGAMSDPSTFTTTDRPVIGQSVKFGYLIPDLAGSSAFMVVGAWDPMWTFGRKLACHVYAFPSVILPLNLQVAEIKMSVPNNAALVGNRANVQLYYVPPVLADGSTTSAIRLLFGDR